MLIQAYWNPVREGATATDDMKDRPEDTTVTGGVAVRAVVETLDIMQYKIGTRMSIGTSQVLMPPTPPTDGETPQTLPDRREMPT